MQTARSYQTALMELGFCLESRHKGGSGSSFQNEGEGLMKILKKKELFYVFDRLHVI